MGGHEFLAWKEQSRVCSHLAAYQGTEATLTGVGTAERVSALDVSADFLPLLGVQPVLGRGFLPEEDQTGGPPVVMISYGFWERYCGADRSIIGRPLTINDFPLTVIGVLPASFQFLEPADLYLPLRLERAKEAPGAGRVAVTMIKALARLKPGVDLEQARAELDGIAKQANTAILNAAKQESPDSPKAAGNANLPIGLPKRADQDRAPKRDPSRLGTQIGVPSGVPGKPHTLDIEDSPIVGQLGGPPAPAPRRWRVG